MSRNSLIKKGLVVAVILLFISVSVIPTVSSRNEVEPISNEVYGVMRLYMFGHINNLTIYDSGYYEFETENLWYFHIQLCFEKQIFLCFHMEFAHLEGTNYWGFGYKFRGIITPNIICGYFYKLWI